MDVDLAIIVVAGGLLFLSFFSAAAADLVESEIPDVDATTTVVAAD